MPYCVNCGMELSPNAKFCPDCGTPTGVHKSGNVREQIYAGKIYKCPNCGEILKSFDAVCPTCGYELRGSGASNSVKEFAAKIEAIEAAREQKNYRGVIGVYASIIDAEMSVSKTDQQLISMIKNFAVPNTKEDMLEFMILATSNVNLAAYDVQQANIPKRDQEINAAWMSKARQVYEKAMRSRSADDTYIEIKALYEECKESLRDAKKRHDARIRWTLIICFGLLLLIMIIPAIILMATT